jgi:hypothetical protein
VVDSFPARPDGALLDIAGSIVALESLPRPCSVSASCQDDLSPCGIRTRARRAGAIDLVESERRDLRLEKVQAQPPGDQRDLLKLRFKYIRFPQRTRFVFSGAKVRALRNSGLRL